MERPDPQFSTNEISRATSKPTKKDQRSIVRKAKYFKDRENPKIKQEFEVVALSARLTVHRDSDWAGC